MNYEPHQLEPLSIRDSAISISVSLRGSLAQQLLNLQLGGEANATNTYVQHLLASTDHDLIKFQLGTQLVIGLLSERGQFFPDW